MACPDLPVPIDGDPTPTPAALIKEAVGHSGLRELPPGAVTDHARRAPARPALLSH